MTINSDVYTDLFIGFPPIEVVQAVWENSHAEGGIFAEGADNNGYYPPVDGKVDEDDVVDDTNWCVDLLF